MAPNWNDPDDAPDLSAPEWQAKLKNAPVRRGRPRLTAPKEAVSLRIDADVLAYFRATGPGWQSRINDALRQSLSDFREGKPAAE